MADLQPTTYQDALDALSKIADGNGNCFRLKVTRRPNASSTFSQHIATFGNATWQHIADAESWIGTFCGGGIYIIQIFDGKDARRQYGTITPSEIPGAQRPPNPTVTRTVAWTGPELISSSGEAANGAGAVALSNGFTLAGEPHGGDSPRMRAEAGLAGLFSEEKRDLERRAADLAERERRAEVEAIRRESKEQAARMEARVQELIALAKTPPTVVQPPPPPAPFDFSGLLTGLVGLVAPIITAVTTSAAEDRRARIALEETRLAREREDREREREERKALAGRPLIDPQMLQMMESSMKRSEEQTAQFANYLKANAEAAKANAEAQAVTQRSVFQMIIDSAQLQLRAQSSGGESEGIDWGKIVAGALGGLAALKNGPPPGYGQPPPGQLAPGQIQPAAAAPATPAQPEPEVDPAPMLDAIENRIRQKHPPDEIATDVKAALEDPASKAEIQAEGGLFNVFDARLADFAEDPANSIYMGALMSSLQKAGIVPD
jgi:hypothetical protein